MRLSLPQPEIDACTEAVLNAGTWEFGDYQLASGEEANNKLFLERLRNVPESHGLIIKSMGKLVMRHEPDVLWGAPTEGQDLADDLGLHLGLPVAHLEKVDTRPGHKTFRFVSSEDRELIDEAECAVGIDDVTTQFTTLGGALRLTELYEKTRGFVAIWRRGAPDAERPIGIPAEWLIQQHLPNIITPDHPFYQKYGHLAIKQGDYDA